LYHFGIPYVKTNGGKANLLRAMALMALQFGKEGVNIGNYI